MDQTLINRIVEATLLASSQPVSLAQLRELFAEDQPAPNGAIEAALEHLQADAGHRGVELVEVASGFRYQVKSEVHGWVARLWTERQTRYTRATLETLALIAYRQPITRGEIEQVRGVTVSSNIIKALEEREWIRVVGHRDVPGRPALFGTTKAFLDYFGLKRLDELPPLSELKDIGELEPQLQFDGASGVAPRIGMAGIDGATAANAADGAAAADARSAQAANDDAGDAGEGAMSAARPEHATATGGVDGAVPGGDAGTGRPTDTTSDAGTDTGTSAGVARDPDGGDGDAHADADASADGLDFRSERPVVFHDDDFPQSPDGADGGIDPEAAPGLRAATENDTAPGSESPGVEAITAFKGRGHGADPVSSAVETTTVPALTTASIDAAESESND
jgi:segregation and condensation protein B